jgi:hypothetical protein
MNQKDVIEDYFNGFSGRKSFGEQLKILDK